MIQSVFTGGLIGGGYTGPVLLPILSGGGSQATGITFIGTEFEFDIAAGWPYQFVGGVSNYMALINILPSFNTALFQSASTNLTHIGR